MFFAARPSLIYLTRAAAFSFDRRLACGYIFVVELNVDCATAWPQFLKKAMFGRFLMQVSMSASVMNPSLSMSSMFEYLIRSSIDRFFSTFCLRNSAKRALGIPTMPGAATVLTLLAADSRLRRASDAILFYLRK